MAKFRWALVLSALTIAAGLKAGVAASTFEEHDCIAAPRDAVTKLPGPLGKWGQITCTSLGEMLTSHDGWVWIMPDASGEVLIPAQDIENAKDAATTEAYFTKIDVAQVKGEEFASA